MTITNTQPWLWIVILGGSDIECEEIQFEANTYTPAQPQGLHFKQEMAATHEGVPFATQAKIRAYDTNVR